MLAIPHYLRMYGVAFPVALLVPWSFRFSAGLVNRVLLHWVVVTASECRSRIGCGHLRLPSHRHRHHRRRLLTLLTPFPSFFTGRNR